MFSSNSSIADALITNMFSQLDLECADRTLSELGDADDFVEWLGSMLWEPEMASRFFRGELDIVGLVYEYLIDSLDQSDDVIAYIRDSAMGNIYCNYIATSIDYDLSDDDEFKKLLRKEVTQKMPRNATVDQLLDAYLEEHEDMKGEVLEWVLGEMNITVGESVCE